MKMIIINYSLFSCYLLSRKSHWYSRPSSHSYPSYSHPSPSPSYSHPSHSPSYSRPSPSPSYSHPSPSHSYANHPASAPPSYHSAVNSNSHSSAPPSYSTISKGIFFFSYCDVHHYYHSYHDLALLARFAQNINCSM